MTQPTFNHHICLVTGGTQGIGWAIVQALAAQGARVYACGLSQNSLARAQTELQTLPWRDSIFLQQCDVTNRVALEGWIEQIYEKNGRIDILINNAAFVRWEDVATMSVEDAQQSMRVGYEAMVIAIKKTLPYMQTAGRGHIVNMGSITARILVAGSSAAYAATKAAIDVYTQTLNMELAHTPIKATLVRLGTTAGTDFFKKHVQPGRMPRLSQYLPPLTPPHVAQAVVQAIHRQQQIITLPRYLAPLAFVYTLFPGFSRWLANLGGQNQPDYGDVKW